MDRAESLCVHKLFYQSVRSGPFLVMGPVLLLLLLVSLLLQPLQLGLVHHLLDQVFLPPHPVPQVLGKVGDQVRDQGLDGEDHVLRNTECVVTNAGAAPLHSNSLNTESYSELRPQRDNMENPKSLMDSIAELREMLLAL